MGPLRNNRHEKFALALTQGRSAVTAYVEAGYQRNRSHASRLAANASIQERVQELQAATAEKVIITKAEILQELKRIGFSDIRRIAKWNGEEVVLKDSAELEPEIAACIKEVSQTSKGVRVQLHDKIAALDKLARHVGLYDAEYAQTVVQIALVTGDELKY